MNELTEALAAVCRRACLQEKWLLAPGLRVGYQWAQSVAATGQPVVNLHVKTLAGVALEWAGGQMARRGVSLIDPVATVLLLDDIWSRRPAGGYLGRLAPSWTLLQLLAATLRDLRLAGVRPADLQPEHLEVPDKARELAWLLEEYLQQLRQRQWVDSAQILLWAREAVEAAASLPADKPLVLIPADLQLSHLEKLLVEAIPAGSRVSLAVDKPGAAGPAVSDNDLAHLRFILDPQQALKPRQDGSLAIFQAVGEANEVREVLRRCLAQNLPLDQVELLHSDTATYVPLIYELAARLRQDSGPLASGPPITYAEGIPVRYFRPGRAVLAWLAWQQQGYPQALVVRMIQDGLLEIPGQREQNFSFVALAGMLRSLSIVQGRDRYLPSFDQQLTALAGQQDPKQQARDEDGLPADEAAQRKLGRRIQGLTILRELIDRLLALLPTAPATPWQHLEAAATFVQSWGRAAGQEDQMARQHLLQSIEQLRQWTAQPTTLELNVNALVVELVQQMRVGGSGPRPGHLHVAHLASGGHSGRRCTFIIGLDDSRFPGGGLPDPLLLDGERQRLSPDLPTASERLGQSLQAFAHLVARLRGQLTLGFASRSIAEDRELFASPVLLAAYRILSGNAEADHSQLAGGLGPAACFAPASDRHCLDEGEWWLWRLCQDQPVAEPQTLLARYYPHLSRGALAATRRCSPVFSEHDGWVPQAGPEIDPTRPDGPVMSATRLQQLATCPLSYFLQYVLKIEPLEEVGMDRSQWLDPMQLGTLLHDTFYRFMAELVQQNQLPTLQNRPRLTEILGEQIADWRKLVPPPNENAFRRQQRELEQTTWVFLQKETQHCRSHRPLYLEATLGMPALGEGTPLDEPEPLTICLPGGKSFRSRGRLDRVDRLVDDDAMRFDICDYKSGSTWKYERDPPFFQGRVIQHVLYWGMAQQVLRRKVSPRAQVHECGFFFPGRRGRGLRINYRPEQLEGGLRVIERLVQILQGGCFLPTDRSDDCRYCSYAGLCGDATQVAQAAAVKLGEAANGSLQPFRELRGYDHD